MNKEEILLKYGIIDGFSVQSDPEKIKEDYYAAMEEYAKEVHFGYKKWIDDIVKSKRTKEYIDYTDSQLYDLYIKNKKT